MQERQRPPDRQNPSAASWDDMFSTTAPGLVAVQHGPYAERIPVAGMTVVPEAKLAREAGICYQPAAMAVNLTGETSPRLTHDNTIEVMGKNLPRLALLLRSAAARLEGRPGCVCPRVPIPYKG